MRCTTTRPPGLPVLLFLLLVLSSPASGQRLKEMEFRNQPIADILLVLAAVSGTSIVPDDTVQGSASYYFSETEFETALSVFLSSYKLYYRKENGIYFVSRVLASYDLEKSTVTLDAEEVDIQLLVKSLARALGKTILHDPLPRTSLTVHIAGLAPRQALQILIRQHPEYFVEDGEGFYYIKKTPQADPQAGGGPWARENIVRRGDLYSIEIDKARFSDVLEELFQKAGREYSLLLRADGILENLKFADKSFEDLLRLVLDQVNADYAVEDRMYYLFEIQRRDILKRYKTTAVITLKHLNVQDLPNLFPQELASQNLYRLDKASNTIILNGSTEEIEPIRQFVSTLDRPQEDRQYYRFDLKHLKVKDLLPILPQRFTAGQPVALPQGNAFLLPCSAEQKVSLEQYLELVDRQAEGFPVTLRFIKSEELLKSLPPSIDKENIIQTGNPSVIFFTGSEAKRRQFLRDLEILDRPVPQIRYELLVVQYQKSKGLDWNDSVDAKPTEAGGRTAFLGSIGQLLNLNFDIVSNFGYQFAVRLNLELGTNTAQVLADTTLNGLSGQEIKFQNTNTFRYREIEIDPDTGDPKYTGVTREITSGLIIGVNGWSSGDGMVTMSVAATVSKRGVDTSSTTGNPPPTSERVVNTHVRTESGRPVVISGLIQQDTDVSVKKVPLLGDIPLLGRLFRSEKQTVENTELVIYIVPHLSYPEPRQAYLGRRLESLYHRYVGGS